MKVTLKTIQVELEYYGTEVTHKALALALAKLALEFDATLKIDGDEPRELINSLLYEGDVAYPKAEKKEVLMQAAVVPHEPT